MAALLSGPLRPDGQPLRILARMDADSTRPGQPGNPAATHAQGGEVDVLVGTRWWPRAMISGASRWWPAINADGALFASDYRAPERLFSLLMQAAGRAGARPG